MSRLAKGLAVACVVFASAASPATAAPGNTRISTVAGGGATAPSPTRIAATSTSLDQPTSVKSFGGDDYAFISDASCRALLLAFDSGQDTATLGYNWGQSVGANDACTGSAASPGGLGSPGAMQAPYSWGHPCCFADYGTGYLITANTDWGRVEEETGGGRIVAVAGTTLASGCGTASPPTAPDNVDAATVQFCKVTSLDVKASQGDFLMAEAHRQNDTLSPGNGKGDLYSVTGSYPGPPGAYTVHHLTGNYRIAAAIWTPFGGWAIADGNGAVIKDGTILAGQYDPGTNVGNTGFGGDGQSAWMNPDVLLNRPSGLAYGWDYELFIADTNNCRIRYLDTMDLGAKIHTFAGGNCNPAPADIGDGGQAGDAYLGHPQGMVLTPRGLLIADRDDNRIRLIDHTSILTGPTGAVPTATPDFTFASLDSSPRFACKLDGNDIGDCPSPFALSAGTADGQHTLAVWDAGHDAESSQVYWSAPADPTPATRTFTIDTTPPEPFELKAPAASAIEASGSPAFTWAAAADVTSGVDHYQLWIDGSKDREVPASACLGGTCSAQPATPLSEGEHKWQVRAIDVVANPRASEERALTIGAPPAASFIASPNPALVGRTVTFDATASSDSSGISRYEWDLDGDGAFETDGRDAPTTTRVYQAPASVNVSLRVTDGTGKQSTTTQALKITSPQGAQNLLGISINSGAQYTRDPNVKILVKAPATANSILVSNDGGFLAPSTFPIATSISWKLDSSGPERLPKTVYTRFLLGPIISETYTDDIILDEIPPVVQQASLVPAKGATAAALKTYVVKVKAKDTNSGVAKVQAAVNKKKPGKLIPYRKTVKVRLAGKPKFIRAQDRAGNVSAWKKLR